MIVEKLQPFEPSSRLNTQQGQDATTQAGHLSGFDHGPEREVHANDPRFVSYYEAQSASPATIARFQATQKVVLRVLGPERASVALDVADIGCNTGMQCHLWAKLGHRVRGLDISEPLVQTARARAEQAGLSITFEVGSATALPWPDSSIDVCIAPELLEHVGEWEACVREFARVLRPGGVLYLTTTNVLCPWQQEFALPLYSWYPRPLKRYCERLARTSRPHLVNYATYPAVNWFSYYGLRKHLAELGLICMDRFDAMQLDNKRAPIRLAVKMIRSTPLLRLLAHVTQSGTLLIAVKQA
jgi:2-polyprenyl-6-hydroxyphenyl methylase/3-demethylubiquinone-9 3-methyltransferase